jgi:MOSC domain-containing protein YiiM
VSGTPPLEGVSAAFRILSINISEKVGVQKTPVGSAVLRAGHGIEGDAHAGDWHRQVSLLAEEDIRGMRGRGIEIGFGDFAENITTSGVDLGALPVGTRLTLGEAVLEITQIGKECHHGCAIYQAVGDCVMPRRGVFARVLRGGEISSESVCHYGV